MDIDGFVSECKSLWINSLSSMDKVECETEDLFWGAMRSDVEKLSVVSFDRVKEVSQAVPETKTYMPEALQRFLGFSFSSFLFGTMCRFIMIELLSQRL